MTHAIDGVIFDLGGVVVDWNPRHLYRKVFDGDEGAMEHFLAEVCTGAWNEQQDAGRSLAEATAERVAAFPELETEIRAFYGRWIEMVAGRVAGTAEIMRRLQARGVKLYALSNWSAETFPLVEHRFEEFRLFEHMFLSGHYGMAKPEARFYEAALAKIPLARERLVFIDDNAVNVAAAAQIGLRSLAFTDAARLSADLRTFGLDF
ncbi:MAG: HAD-IA family hydrolase [Alphaproteobacteria bacterium]|nr:HAD-IA family hydrolase [Alphaproteobacteria bacterium]